jgi:SAM-dependent methyltransferase
MPVPTVVPRAVTDSRRLLARWTTATGLAACLAVAAAGSAQTAAAQTTDREFPAPNRPVSRIVAPRWIAEDDRDAFGEAEKVMAILNIRAGQRVADIGAGDGYYVRHLSERVGARGLVYGQDIEPRYLAMLRERVADAKWTNVEVIAGTPGDPALPAASIDVALMIHMYHEISDPYGLLYRLAPAFRSGGRLAILDQDAPTDRHGTPPRLLICELGAVGYSRVRRDEMPDGAYVITFRAPDAASRPRDAAEVRARVAAANCRP